MFWRNKDGNVAMITALVFIPIVAIMGAGIDIIRATSIKQELQASLDSATLAAANLNNSGDIDEVVAQFINSNMQNQADFLATMSVNVDDDVALNSKAVTVRANGKINTYFLGLLGITEMKVEVESTAIQSITNVEIALVLDISSSMRGSKLTNLKTAASSFVEQMLDDDSVDVTSISIVPFGGTVNIGEDLFNEFVTDAPSRINNPSEAQYDIGDDIFDEDFVFSSGDYCLEYPDEAFSDEVLDDSAYSQVPHFWKWRNFNPWCPMASSAAVFNSNNKTKLVEHLDGMTMSDGTGMDIGSKWGLKALSPNWQGKLGGDFAARPAAYNDETLKVFVVMTDGEITKQFRPEDYSLYSVHTNRSTGMIATGNGHGDSGNSNNQQTLVNKGSSSSTASSDNAVGHFKRVCDSAKTSGAVVYTIGFQINVGALSDELLQYCASDASKYYHVESLDIASAFDAIAASVNALRLTQ